MSGGPDLEPGIPEQALEHGTDDRIVFGDEDPLRDRGGIALDLGGRYRAPGLAGIGCFTRKEQEGRNR